MNNSQIDLIKRAEALASKTESGSITPEELGYLIRDVRRLCRRGRARGWSTRCPQGVHLHLGDEVGYRLPLATTTALRRVTSLPFMTLPTLRQRTTGVSTCTQGQATRKLHICRCTLPTPYSDEDKSKVDLIKTDAGDDYYLAGDGNYKPIHVPQAPVQSISVGGTNLPPDSRGNVDLTIPKHQCRGWQSTAALSPPDDVGHRKHRDQEWHCTERHA